LRLDFFAFFFFATCLAVFFFATAVRPTFFADGFFAVFLANFLAAFLAAFLADLFGADFRSYKECEAFHDGHNGQRGKKDSG
jgi:hypothetical protein